MNNLKIIYIQHTTEVGGSLISLYNTMRGIQNLRPDFKITVLCKNKKIHEWYKQKGINSIYLPFIGFLGHCTGCTYQLTNPINLYSLLKQLLLMPLFVLIQYFYFKKLSPDIIHLNSSVLLSSAIAAKLAKKKIIWHIREIISNGNMGIRKRLLILSIKRLSDKVIAISPFEAQTMESCLKFEGKLEVVFNFIDFEEFNPSLYNKSFERERLNIPKDAKVVLSLGGFNPIKGSKELLETLPKLESKIHVAFAGEKKVNWEKGHKLEGYLERIHILGSGHEVPKLLSAADLVYFGGTIPHFPRPIYEAWALKKAVVAFNIDGVRQNVFNGEDGYLVDRNSAEDGDLATAINFLLSNETEALIKKMGENGYLKATEKFDIKKNIQNIIQIYQKIIVQTF